MQERRTTPNHSNPESPPATPTHNTSAGRTQFRNRIIGLRYIKASELVKNPQNHRLHGDEQHGVVRAVLSDIGYAAALIAYQRADGAYVLIDGHLRLDLSPDQLLPVLLLDVDEAEANKLLATLDPLSAMAGSDGARLEALIATIQTDNPSLRDFLDRLVEQQRTNILNPADLLEAPTDPSEQLRSKWDTKGGQVWEVERHRVIVGDSTDQEVLARLWDDHQDRIREVVTDPAYGIDYASKNKFLNRVDRGNRVQKPIFNDDRPEEAPDIFSTALRVATHYAHRGASCYATVPSGPSLPNFIAAFNRSGFAFKSLLIWRKNHFVLGRSDYQYCHESVLYGWKLDGPHYFVEDRTQSSIFEIDKPQASEYHPTTKPIQLFARMIYNSSRPGELIYDPFAGSGTSVLAAHQLGRIGYAVEIDPAYVAVILERLSMLGLKPVLVSQS
jgi:DNA modification methylase